MNSQSSSTKTGLGGFALEPWKLALLIVAAAGGGALAMWWLAPGAQPAAPESSETRRSETAGAHGEANASAEPAVTELPKTVELAKEQWTTSGLEMAPIERGSFGKPVQLTGKVTLNQERLAHVFPIVEGSVDEVLVSLGQHVQADDLLVVVHSREIGQAKLTLYQARLQAEIAKVQNRLQTEIAKNAKELVDSLRQGDAIIDLESRFRNRPMGDYRERLLNAYSAYLKSEADVQRLEGIADSGAVPTKQLTAAVANRNADLATFQARIEQIEYEIETSVLRSSQALRQAETEVAVASTNLRILGCSQEDIDDIDPATQGQAISHYPLKAPFDGTVITKDIVLHEQVRPDVQVMSIADLSTVWVTADVYEEHVPMLQNLENQTLKIHNEAWPDREFEAHVFYTGEIMDEQTRTISLRAVADNAERLLKPGMFVTVELPGTLESDVLILPSSAIQEFQGTYFVFVPTGGDSFERRNVTLGPTTESSAVIREGLTAGETVVIRGGFILKSQMLADLMGEE